VHTTEVWVVIGGVDNALLHDAIQLLLIGDLSDCAGAVMFKVM
jgi:hypothetical protein